ncbi:MAG: hypothetical protein C3F08_00375, partial [Candidatus Methylomirabilota bacterium]
MIKSLSKGAVLFILLFALSAPGFLGREECIAAVPDAVAMSAGRESEPVTIGEGLSGPSELRQYTAAGHVLGFRPGGMVVASGNHALRIEYLNARAISPEGEGATGPARGPAPALGKVTYRDLWDGITVVYEKTEYAVAKSTYVIQPGEAETFRPLDEIRLRYNVPVHVDRNGDLVLLFATGEMRETRPVAWQEIRGKRTPVEAGYRLLGEREVGFRVAAYNPRYTLVIDPVLSWNTFLGGTEADSGWSIAVDASGNSYVTGSSSDTWGSPVQPFGGYSDAFVAKLDANGGLLWNTFLGGIYYKYGYGIAVDASGNSYVTGAYNEAAFVAKFDTNGNIQWNIYLGEWDTCVGLGVALDPSGNIDVVGSSYATWGSPKRQYSGNSDVFVAELSANGAVQWNTFLGGTSLDIGYSIAVDSSGNCLVSGLSETTWGSPLQPHSGSQDALVAKLDTNGNLLWNTFLGGIGIDKGWRIGVDAIGNSYVTGESRATWGSPLRSYGGSADAFVAKLNINGALQWNTFLGNWSWDFGYGIAVDASGNSYVTGSSQDVSWGSPIRDFSGFIDSFVAELNSNGALLWNTFLGGVSEYDSDCGNGIALDSRGNSYVVGESRGTWGSPVRQYDKSKDAFVAKIGNGVHVDFNDDGQEDILWRYNGTGGYNRA